MEQRLEIRAIAFLKFYYTFTFKLGPLHFNLSKILG